MESAVSVSEGPVAEDDGYPQFLAAVRRRAETYFGVKVPLFETDAAGLFDLFLANLPADQRQHYNCRACRRFVERFGGLVCVGEGGSLVSLMWDPEAVPAFFRESVGAMARSVRQAKITGVFLLSEPIWGLPSNDSPKGTWHHLSVHHGEHAYKASVLQTAEQRMAERRQEFEMLCRGLADFSADAVRQAHTMLTTGSLYRSEKCIGVAKWLLELQDVRSAASKPLRDNLTWLAVATAPAGFCHVRSGMIGTLLEDIQSGMAFAEIKRRFDEKMDPLQYQRPQAAPTAGNIAQAEAIVAKLQSAGALERRFARVEEVQALWRPAPAKAQQSAGGVFGHLMPKRAAATQVDVPPVTMTWEKFRRTVLPEAERIEFFVPSQPNTFMAMVTAAKPDSPPILQWDREDLRNQFSWYFHGKPSLPSSWNLSGGSWVEVTAVTLQPSMWADEKTFAHQGQKVFFLLENARDTTHTGSGGLFPECMRSEYHSIRATIEAHTKSAVVAGAKDATACGIGLSSGGKMDHQFRVTSKGTKVVYKLDRWD